MFDVLLSYMPIFLVLTYVAGANCRDVYMHSIFQTSSLIPALFPASLCKSS